MRVSVITVCFNSASTIANTLHSVNSQLHPDVEHVIIDGGSTDATLELVRKIGQRVRTVVCEPDHGIYDAMNKGMAKASGEIICFLNSDDEFSNGDVLASVVDAFKNHPDSAFVYGDLNMIDSNGQLMRHWRTGSIGAEGLKWRQIPHPSLFIKRQVLQLVQPPFDPSYRIAADLKQQLILINQMGMHGHYLPYPLVKMRLGGASTRSLGAYTRGWRESRRAYNEVFGSGGTLFTLGKVLRKIGGMRV